MYLLFTYQSLGEINVSVRMSKLIEKKKRECAGLANRHRMVNVLMSIICDGGAKQGYSQTLVRSL